MARQIALLFSDITLGTEEYGFIPRKKDPEDEDFAYRRYLRKTYPELVNVRVANGYVFVP